MSRGGPRDPQASLELVPRALLGSSVAILAVAAIVHQQGQGGSGPEVVSWMAVAWAAAAPLLASLVRGEGLVAARPSQGQAPADAARLQRTIVFFGVLESAVVFAAIALVVSPPVWPLAAALFPLAVMALNLPPRQG